MLPSDLDPPDHRVRLLTWAVTALLACGFAACLAKGADRPSDPQLPRATLPGFGEVALRIEPSPNQVRCALLAATEQQRERGLMGVRDLNGYVGMVFRFSADSQAGFHMKDTPMPLSIAWFDGVGKFVSAADMAPCTDKGATCHVFSASGPFRYAIEVPQGQLDDLGIGPGSRLVLQATTCPT